MGRSVGSPPGEAQAPIIDRSKIEPRTNIVGANLICPVKIY